MAKYTFSVLSTCEGGCHYTVQIAEDGIDADIIVIDVSMNPPATEGLLYSLHKRIENITESADRILAIESFEVDA